MTTAKSWIPSCLCVRWSHKTLFYFCAWLIIWINIFKTGLLRHFANQTRMLHLPTSETEYWSQILSITGLKAHSQARYRNKHTPALLLSSVSQKLLTQTGCSHNTKTHCTLYKVQHKTLMCTFLDRQEKLFYGCVFVCTSKNSKSEPARSKGCIKGQKLKQTVQTIPRIPLRSRINWPWPSSATQAETLTPRRCWV